MRYYPIYNHVYLNISVFIFGVLLNLQFWGLDGILDFGEPKVLLSLHNEGSVVQLLPRYEHSVQFFELRQHRDENKPF